MTAKRVQRRRPRRKHTKKTPTTRQLAKKIQKMEHHQDLKWFDVNYAPTAIPATGDVLSEFMNINDGVSFNERIGSKITPTSLQVKMSISTDPSRLGPSKVRMLVFWDRQTNGAPPVLLGQDNGVLDNSIIGQAPLSQIYCPINYLTRDRYHVIFDKVYTFNLQTLAAIVTPDVTEYGVVTKYIRKNFRLGRIVKYDSSAGSIGDLVSNSLHVAFLSDDTSNLVAPQYEGGIRMYFKDT